MFDKKSDYALNKRNQDAIAYISATGATVLLTRADFSSEAEFLQWKAWSDGDYKAAEQEGRGFYDNCISLDERLDCIGAVVSAEETLIATLTEAEQSRASAELFAKVMRCLTRKQFRRLWMFHVDGMSITTIAHSERVSQPSVSESIARAEKNISVFFKKSL